MGFKKAKQPKPRGKELPYDTAGEGLYPGEVAVTLDPLGESPGGLVAVSAESRWLESGEGVHIRAWARLMGDDGTTQLGPHGQHIETIASHTFPPPQVEKHGVAALEREMLLVVMGEPPTEIDVVTDPKAPAPTNLPAGTTLSPNQKKAPLVPWSEQTRMNWSIRHAIAAARDTSPLPDAAVRLGI